MRILVIAAKKMVPIYRCITTGSEVIKLFSCSIQLSMKFFNAHKYKNIKISRIFQAQISLEYYFSRS